MPSKFKEFLCDSQNKEELFHLISEKVSIYEFAPAKEVYMYITSGETVISKGTQWPMRSCDDEEADSQICIHIKDALKKGAKRILVRTVDTDIIVILIGIFHQFQTQYPEVSIWVAFGAGKHFRYYSINTLCSNLGKQKSCALSSLSLNYWFRYNITVLWKGKKESLGGMELLSRCYRSLLFHI